jgi:uncharacterized protein involved in copper resistance
VNATVRLLPIVCAFVVTQAFAAGPGPSSTEPQQSASQSSPAAPAAATTQSAAPQSSSPATAASDATAKPSTDEKPAATSGAAPAKVVLVDKTLTDAQVKQLLARGYKPKGSGADVLYCRREQQLGSRFETKVCKTADQIKRDELDSQETTQGMQRMQTASPTK